MYCIVALGMNISQKGCELQRVARLQVASASLSTRNTDYSPPKQISLWVVLSLLLLLVLSLTLFNSIH
jgi:hypothetical protein